MEQDHIPPLTAAELERLPIFPLPRVVLFPGGQVPLYLFEPRYRTMIEDCVERGPMAIAIAMLEPGWQSAYEGAPKIRPVCGAGRIVSHQRNPDGTWYVLLHGLSRVHVEELPAELPYRVAQARVLRDPDPPQGAFRSDVAALFSCASAVAGVVQREHEDFVLDVSPRDPPGLIADRIADRLIGDADRRQAILEAVDVQKRLRLVTDAVGELMALLTGDRARKRPVD